MRAGSNPESVETEGRRWWRPVVIVSLGLALTWLVVTHSLVAYLARAMPETALILNSANPRALHALAERELAGNLISEREPQSSQANRNGNGKPAEADRLRLLSEMVSRSLETVPGNGPRPEKPPGTAASSPTLDLSPDRIEKIQALTELVLVSDPLNARALRTLGQLALAAGDEVRTTKYMSASAHRSIRESAALYWLLGKSYQERDYAAVIRFADALLRTRSQAGPNVTPVLLRLAEHADGSLELRQALFNNPPWRSHFLAALAQYANDPRVPLDLLLALRNTAAPPTAVDLKNCLNALIARKQFEIAYYAWLQFLPPDQLSSAGFLFNGSFEAAPSGVPFDWVIGEGNGVTIEFVERPDQNDQRALRIEFGYGRVEFGGVRQLTMLAPGTYEFKGKYQGEVQGKRGLMWRVTCLDTANTLIGESSMAVGASPQWKDIAFSFTVPQSACEAQQVRLEFGARMASEQLVSGTIWYDEVQISRLQSPSTR